MATCEWNRMEELFHQAAELAPAARPAFLDHVCGRDEKLRRELESLLAADDPDGQLIQAAVEQAIDQLPGDADEGSNLIGTRIGPYSITGLIGKGGMGAVYRAVRDDHFRMQVAIKLLKRGTDTEAALRRFRIERQILAGLQHPNIARLLDGGATDNGLPYFVMEYVEGTPLLEYAAPLPIRQRLELFQAVCAAVQCAHQNLVVHRDIKPANILVTAQGIPKLLDFGIAKLLDPAAEGTAATRTASARLMTPDYASPEQVRGEPVTTATDIYSLGALLYELLTGQRAHRVDTYSPGAIEKEICIREPRKPSAVAKHLDRDLDNIVLMALRKEPQRRYASVAQLSQDIDRFLRDLPVEARKESPLYNGRKFLKRNRARVIEAALALAGALILAVVMGPHRAGGGVLSLAVIQIENQIQDASLDGLDRGMRELLTAHFAEQETFQVVSGERVSELISRRVKGSEHLSAAQARDVARDAHAGLFLTGALVKAGKRVRLDMRIQETATGRTRFKDQVEGAGAPAIFSMADEAATRILARLAGREAAHKTKAGSVLTDNLEALRAYQEGLRDRDEFRTAGVLRAFQRAINLDPHFVMAHYYLAEGLRFAGDVPEARRTIARAVQFARDAGAPRLQRLLAQSLQMRLDLRLDEATKVLETAHRDFGLETEPLFQLAGIYNAEGRFAEAAVLLEKVVRMDPGHALAHDQLGYAYALQGDVVRGVASINRYAALLPSGSEVPVCSRGDALLINARYGEAIAQYQKINYRDVTATAAAYGGDYTLADSALAVGNRKRRAWYEAAGDLAAARGQLDGAALYYEDAAKMYQPNGPLRPWWALLRVERIFLEQRLPERVLALGRRDKSPWAPGLRGTAYLIMHKEAAAEKEFGALRDAISPILGDYVAEKVIEFHRMQAASYAGRFDRVIQMWPSLPRSFWGLYALDVGRAYLESGVLTEAEHHLRAARTAQLAFFWNSDMQAQHNFLTWMLAEYYLGKVLEKKGGESEAIATYRAFVTHFGHSSAQLPQVAEARAVLSRFHLSPRGKLLFRDDFAGSETEGTYGRRSHVLAYRNAIFEFSFRMDGARPSGMGPVGLRLSHQDSLACKLIFDQERMRLKDKDQLDAPELASLDTGMELGTWHKVIMEVHGKRVVVQLDGKHTIAAESPRLDVDKTRFEFNNAGRSAAFANVRVYEVSSK